jgi:esterase FrsA
MSRLAQNMLVTLCALTRTTERAARRRGVGYFLPALFVDRFTKLGGIDRKQFATQLDGCRSFTDQAWATYWRAFADEQLVVAGVALDRLGGPNIGQLLDRESEDVVKQVRDVLSPAWEVFTDRAPHSVRSFASEHPEQADAAVAVDALAKAMTYLFAASWPGWTQRRLQAYADSRRLFDVLLRALAPAMGVDVEVFTLDMGDDAITGYAILPSGVERAPAILVTNGLEGTIQEVALPALRHRPPDTALFVMEMPGTFAYRQPLSLASERYYRAALDHVSAHPRIDGDRIGMLGMSFGAHWSTRMAARDKRLKAVVSNGGPYHRGFKAAATFGMPEIMLWTLQKTTGTRNPLDLSRTLGAWSLRQVYREIPIPVLAINGDTDTLVPTQDTVDLAQAAPRGELKLYPNDDHCAMGHYDECIGYSTSWLQQHLQAKTPTR